MPRRTITPELHLAISYDQPRFAKPGEPQADFIKRIMRGLKPKPSTRTYPKFTPGMTTRRYMELFACFNQNLSTVHDASLYDRPAPTYDSTVPEVVECALVGDTVQPLHTP